MAGGKSTQPLFELLAKGQSESLTRQAKRYIPGSPEEPVAPPAPVQPHPVPTPLHASMEPETPISTAAGERRRTGRTVTVPRMGVYLGMGVLLAVLVGVWSIAYRQGVAAEKAAWQRSMTGPGIGADPLIDPTGGAGARQEPTGATPPKPMTNRNTNDGMTTGLRSGILTSGGVLAADPRQPGRNYLKLATLGRPDAERAIAYLASGGVEAMGVPVVDPRGGAANNPPRYEVFATVGITGEEYANNRPVRSELEAKVARIGERFKREAKGPTDFSKPLWMKHTP